jgi:hypothetical protein
MATGAKASCGNGPNASGFDRPSPTPRTLDRFCREQEGRVLCKKWLT